MTTHTPPGPQATPTFNPAGRKLLVRWRSTCTYGHNIESLYPPCRQKPTGWFGWIIDLDGTGSRFVLEPTCAEHYRNDYGHVIAAQYGIRLIPPQWPATKKEDQ